MLRRVQKPKSKNRLDRMAPEQVQLLMETSMQRMAELLRGLMHNEIDRGWLLSELDLHSEQMHLAVRSLRDRYEAEG